MGHETGENPAAEEHDVSAEHIYDKDAVENALSEEGKVISRSLQATWAQGRKLQVRTVSGVQG